MDKKRLDRRASLKVFGMLAGAAALAPLASSYPTLTALAQGKVDDNSTAEWDGMVYAIGKEGILKSKDRGTTWEVSINLGSDCQVGRLFATREGINAEVLFQGLPFSIVSGEGEIWRTGVQASLADRR